MPVLLKYLNHFWSATLGILLTNFKICLSDNTTGVVTFEISNEKIHVINSKQEKTAAATEFWFSSNISNWSKYQSQVSLQTHNICLVYSIDPGF